MNKLPRNKSGSTELTGRIMVMIILVVIFIVATLFFQDKLFTAKKDTLAKDTCKSSVYAMHLQKYTGLPAVQELNCPTTYLNLTSKYRADIKYQLANAMYDCFDEFGQGKYELFKDVSGVKNYCIICSIATFKNNMSISASEFDEYLSSTTIYNTDVKYRDFLLGYKSNSDVLAEYRTAINSGHYDITTTSNYAVVFTYLRKGYLGKFLSTGIGAGAGGIGALVLAPFTGGGSLFVGALAAAGGVIGYQSGNDVSQDWEAGVALMPYSVDSMKSLGCSELPAIQKQTVAGTK